MDWDKFIEDGSKMQRTLSELSSRLAKENADSRRKRTQSAVREVKRLRALMARDRALRDVGQWTSRPLVVRERPPESDDTRFVLAEIRQDDLMLRREGVRMRESMATRMDMESLKDDIRLAADGFAQIQQRLHDVAGLLRRFLTDRPS